MQNILNRILANKDLDVRIVNFGDKVNNISECCLVGSTTALTPVLPHGILGYLG